MILVRPSVELEHITPDALKLIERAGRTCYKSEDRITDNSAEKFARMIIKRGHESVLEHAHATVRIVCDRGVTHELVRHRIGISFSQESTRYVNYSGAVTYVIPPWVDIEPGGYACQYFPSSLCREDYNWFETMYDAEGSYINLLDAGWTPQQARAVLPNSTKTEIVITANFREWRHIINLRTSPAAHPQMVEVMTKVQALLHDAVPAVF